MRESKNDLGSMARSLQSREFNMRGMTGARSSSVYVARMQQELPVAEYLVSLGSTIRPENTVERPGSILFQLLTPNS